MPVEAGLIELLACPRCDKQLEGDASQYSCPACKVDFPLVGDIPWLFADPDSSLGEWRGRLHFSLQQIAHESQRISAELQQKELGQLTRTRLEAQLQAQDSHREKLQEILAPIGVQSLQAGYDSYLALRTRLPSEQGLNTYYANVQRDWAWGDEENAASMHQIEKVLQGEQDLGNALVLGAGAGRLTYDLHSQLKTTMTVAVDFNPLLLLIAKRVMAGECMEMYEFPAAPRALEDYAVLRRLAAPAAVRGGLQLVFADVLRAPFLPGSFDTIVTPWLIDIVNEDLAVFAARVNRLLKPGGRWINFGSLVFDQALRARRYSAEETLEIVGNSGFTDVSVSEATIPYMSSPASRHGRRERTFTFCVTKSAEVAAPDRHIALPDWIVRGEEPVPISPSFHTQTMSTRIYAFVMSLIDGKRSIKDMASILEQQKLMPKAEAEAAIRNFLIRMYDDSQRNTSL